MCLIKRGLYVSDLAFNLLYLDRLDEYFNLAEYSLGKAVFQVY